jgi:hypothetical protein
MRDGIPKTIPVGRKWQRVVECADRPADKGTSRVVDCICEAIRETVEKQLPTAQRELLIKACDGTQAVLPGLECRIPDLHRLHGPTEQLEKIFIAADKATDEGEKFPEAIRNSLAAKIQSDMAAHCRLIKEDLATKIKPAELRQLCAEIDRAASCVDCVAEADRMLKSNGNGDDRKIRLSPDEDLRR